jgi:nucleoside-diphosphate-sugar epimerase
MRYEVPERIGSAAELEDALAQPYPEAVDLMKRLVGDIIILGVAGKMGPSLARMARRACDAAGVRKRVVGVARFSDVAQRRLLDDSGVETVVCDLADPAAVAKLPDAANVIFMAGRKFGSVGSEALTWIMNVIVPGNVARRYAGSRIVAFSTGCVYPIVAAATGGCTEDTPPAPVGEYANSCLGRERVFEHHSTQDGTPVVLFRLNYAVEPRYGVLTDVAEKVWRGEAVDLSVGAANVIWQGDANNRALLCLEHACVPAAPLNVTGPETLSIRALAQEFGRLLGREASFIGSDAGKAYLSNASRSTRLFGAPRVPLGGLVRWTADWISHGGAMLGKPTHFSVTDGQFLDKPKDGMRP